MYKNYSDVLESYLIPAEEGFKETFKSFFNEDNLMKTVMTIAAAVISFPIVSSAVKKYKTNRLLAPFAPAKAMTIIINNKKYKTVQFNSNIYDYIAEASNIIVNAEKLFNNLNKAVVSKDENKAIVAFDAITTYFENATDNNFTNISDGENITADKDSADVENLRNALNKYLRTCEKCLASCEDIYDIFTEDIYVPSETKYGYYVKKTVYPNKSLEKAITYYQEVIEQFHAKVINIKIKRK